MVNADFVSQPELYGLVLAGGHSRRMQRDKGALRYHTLEQRQHAFKLLATICRMTFLSCRSEQLESIAPALPCIVDQFGEIGPAAGLLSAAACYPNVAWLVVACDLPRLTQETLEELVKSRDSNKSATLYKRHGSTEIEPLCGIWEPPALELLQSEVKKGKNSLKRALKKTAYLEVTHFSAIELSNYNTPQDLKNDFRI